MNEQITIYDTNTITLQCTVDGVDSVTGLTDYDATFYVKENLTDTVGVIINTGTTDGNVITFNIDYTENALSPGAYIYEVRIVSDLSVYTVSQGRYIVKDSIVTI